MNKSNKILKDYGGNSQRSISMERTAACKGVSQLNPKTLKSTSRCKRRNTDSDEESEMDDAYSDNG